MRMHEHLVGLCTAAIIQISLADDATIYSRRALEGQSEDSDSSFLTQLVFIGLAYLVLVVGASVGWHLDREDRGKAKIYPGVAAAYVIQENNVYLKAAARYAAAAKVYEELFGEDCPQALEARAKQAEAQEHIQQLEPQEKEFQDSSWPDVFHFSNSKTRFWAEMKKRHPLGNVIYVYSHDFTRPHRALSLVCRILGIMLVCALFHAVLYPKAECELGDEMCENKKEVEVNAGLVILISVAALLAAAPITSLIKKGIWYVALSSDTVARFRRCEKMDNVHAASRNLRVYNKTHKPEDDVHRTAAQRLKRRFQKLWERCVLIPQLGPEEEFEVEARVKAEEELHKLRDGGEGSRDTAFKKLFLLTDKDMRRRAYKSEFVRERALYDQLKYLDAEARQARLLEASREAQMSARQRLLYSFNRLEIEPTRPAVPTARALLVYAAVFAYLGLSTNYVFTFARKCQPGVLKAWAAAVIAALGVEHGLYHPCKILLANVAAPRALEQAMRVIDSSDQCAHFKACLASGLPLQRATKMAIRGGSDQKALIGELRGADALRAAILAAQLRGDDGPLSVSLADLHTKHEKGLSLAEKLKLLDQEKHAHHLKKGGLVPHSYVEVIYDMLQCLGVLFHWALLLVRLGFLVGLMSTVVATSLLVVLILFYSDNYLFE